jgi:hypothetical protein
MTTDKDRVLPGHYKLLSAVIVSYDGQKRIEISNLIPSFSIEESLESDSIRGMVSVFDTVGFLEDFPVRGEELLIMEVEDALKKTRTYEFNIYKVTNVKIKDSNDGLIYDMYFTSKWRFEASKRRIIRSFDQPVSVIASLIFNEYYPDNKDMLVEDTDGTFRCVIPNYTPMQALNFLASRAYSQRSKSCSFRFFENADNFFFVSDEYLFKRARDNQEEIKEFTYSDALEKSGSQFLEQMKNIVTIENSERVNTMLDLYSGAYTSHVIEIDLVRKVVENKMYRYENSMYTATSGLDPEGVHSSRFMTDYFTEENARRYLVVKDYSSIGDIPSNIRGEQYLPEIVQNRVSYRHHLNNTVVHAKLHGRLDLKVGDVISLRIPNFSTGERGREENKQLSGRYLLNDCKQVFMNDVHETLVKLIKLNWSS